MSDPSAPTKSPSRWRLGLVLAAVVIGLDQASKWYILTVVMQPPRVIEVTSFFNLVLAWNPGVSFGLFSDADGPTPDILIGFAGAITLVLLVWLVRTGRRLTAVSLGLIIGGAIGNVIDRASYGAVVDFLDFHAYGWHWPAFNVADSGISIGVALILLDGLLGADGEGQARKEAA